MPRGQLYYTWHRLASIQIRHLETFWQKQMSEQIFVLAIVHMPPLCQRSDDIWAAILAALWYVMVFSAPILIYPCPIRFFSFAKGKSASIWPGSTQPPKVLSQKIVKPPSSEDRSRLCSLSHPPLRLRGCGRASGGGEGGGCSSLVLPVAGRAHTTQRLHSQCPSGTHPILTHPLWSEQWPLVTKPKKVKTLDFPWNLCCLVGCLVTWVSTAISSESSTDCQWWCLSPESCWRE